MLPYDVQNRKICLTNPWNTVYEDLALRGTLNRQLYDFCIKVQLSRNDTGQRGNLAKISDRMLKQAIEHLKQNLNLDTQPVQSITSIEATWIEALATLKEVQAQEFSKYAGDEYFRFLAQEVLNTNQVESMIKQANE